MLRGMLYSIDLNSLLLIMLFLIFFVVINFIVRKAFKSQGGIAKIISLCISLLAVWGINRMDWDVPGFFYSLGLSEDALYTIVPVVSLIFLGLLFWKIGFGFALFLIGLFFFIGSFTPLFQEQGVAMAIGIGLIIIGAIFWRRRWKRKKIRRDFIEQEKYKQGLQKGVEKYTYGLGNKNIGRQKNLQNKGDRQNIKTSRGKNNIPPSSDAYKRNNIGFKK